jgi:YidC/Oxa1 family membrane protein insertase
LLAAIRSADQGSIRFPGALHRAATDNRMQRNVLLFALLSLAVLLGFQLLFPAQPTRPAPATGNTALPTGTAPQSSPPTTAAPMAEAPQTASQPNIPARDVTVESSAVHAVFTTRGGALKSWRLKKYHDASGQALELVPQQVAPDTPRPFSLSVDDANLSRVLASAVFTPSTDTVSLDGGAQSLRFDYRDESGLEAHKTFAFNSARPYVIGVMASVTRSGQPVPTAIEWGPGIGSGSVPHTRGYSQPPQAIFFTDGKVTRIAQTKIEQQSVHEGTFGFAGVDDQYFLASVVGPSQPVRLTYHALDVPVPAAQEPAHFVSWSARFPTPAQETTYFVGPKDFDVLTAVNRDLVRAIDFGMFSWLVVPLLLSLKWVNGYVGNYGWSLIILTVLINLAMFPLRHKSVVSMRKMQEIQPEMKAIQDRYKHLKPTDPARSKMNTELMNLYRERGVNPASGCIPMLLTMPVLFAFYRMLSVAIELRGAPFTLWIHDLVAPDPYFVLPILMGVTMFLQQKMTPSTADPTQQRMMMVMPLVLTGMSLWWSSGLLLYWTVSNVWGIGQQMITNRLIGPPPQRDVRPPAERRLKRAGGGKTDRANER